MSTYAIQNYHKELEKIIHYGGSKKETAIRNAFYYLLNEYAHSKELMLIAEISTKNKQGKIITPDGTLKDNIRNDWGYWESKDESDDIDEEIRKKFDKGYPSDNILFEDSKTAVLYQHGEEVMREDMQDEEQLHKILTRFLSYERPEVHDFREAIEQFKQDIPKVTVAIRDIIEAQQKTNAAMREAQESFLAMAKASINPDINADDVKEMMIQHILSADIFNTIFDEPHFHQENNIARELNKIIDTFFTGSIRRATLGSIKHYYDTINSRAASIADHHEKQKFLKVVYEAFYKGYNPKAADRLGIVYTPNEIVQFMIRSTDYLLHKHFAKTLGDKNVEILDPATGTGTFICDIIDYLPKAKLKHKYKSELHANEVAILPYYIANLNIEYTYKQKMGEYAEFDNLCFVDTLDNTGFNWVGKQGNLFGVSAENANRIKRQNERRISVVIGNPPYNAKQENYNYQNANRTYKEIDIRIKETFIKQGTAQSQIVVYDMYSRFYRWAMDRLNDNGIIAFITNRSFIDGRAFDGFRKTIQNDFDYAYIIDTKSDVRANPKIAGTTHNVFSIQAGVAVLFLVKSSHKQLKTNPCKIEYMAMEDLWRKEVKLGWFAENEISKIEFDNITPDKNNNWINNGESDWDDLISIFDKDGKSGKSEQVIFKNFSLGIASHRDYWVYDFSPVGLKSKLEYFINIYDKSRDDKQAIRTIAWDEDLTRLMNKNITIRFQETKIIKSSFRPFISKWLYYDSKLISRIYSFDNIFKQNENNKFISLRCISSDDELTCLSSLSISDLGYLKTGNGGTFSTALYHYISSGERIENITDWALEQFHKHYFLKEDEEYPRLDENKLEAYLRSRHEARHPGEKYIHEKGGEEFPAIRKDDIFNYVYAVLHNPAYRKKYELNLKREFPRIPFYDNFWQWAKWGEQLMSLHIHYETAELYKLNRIETATKEHPKCKLKALKETGIIALDDNTELHGIPAAAWEYKLGNRSALEWILDQYKEKKPTDPTIAEKFNTYKFEDYKEQVIDLLKRVCTVSVETMKVVREMENL
ncbi:MAG TPA: N-6 DNA methylase [Panacibacter sp.]|nr:N-6 DNA methylase [Panacibacter sp.]